MSDILKYLLSAMGGALLAGSTAYIVMAKDVAFIKGQLIMVLDRLKQLDKLFEEVGSLRDENATRKRESDAAHEKLREFAKRVSSR